MAASTGLSPMRRCIPCRWSSWTSAASATASCICVTTPGDVRAGTSNGAAHRPISRATTARSGLHAELFEIELAFDGAEGRVVDLARLAELDHRCPLRVDDSRLNLLVLKPLLAPFGSLARILRGQVLSAVPKAGLQPIQ